MNMRLAVLGAVLSVWGWGTLAASTAHGAEAAKAAGKDELQAFIKKLEEEAAKRYEGDDPDKELIKQVQALVYDDESVKHLGSLLGSQRDPAVAVFVTNEMLAPLKKADKAVINKALPMVGRLNSRFQLKPLPKFPPAVLNAARLPDKFPTGVPLEQLLAQMSRTQEARRQKTSRDEEVVRYNREVVELTITYADLLLAAGDANDDARVLQMIGQEESRGSALFSTLLMRIVVAARTMDKERAERMYRSLDSYLNRVQYRSAKYADLSRPMVLPDQNSRYEEVAMYPYSSIVKALNAVAKVADQPLRKELSDREIAEMLKKAKGGK